MTKSELLDKLNEGIKTFSEADQALIMQAYHLAEEKHSTQKRASGEEYIVHPLNVALNLINLNSDRDMIIAGLLHDVVEDTDTTLDQLRTDYGEDVAMLVDGVTKISKMKTANIQERKAETIRKMLLAMIRDIRVIIVKLADRIHNMSTIEYMTKDKATRIAGETLDIYAPLAGKIGMNIVKNRLENYALQVLHPGIYADIDHYINATEGESQVMLDRIRQTISARLSANHIQFYIKTRQKHHYSIYLKMKKSNKKINEIFDIFGIRIITDTVENCYMILGMVHSVWQPITGRFKDYIAAPKDNGYRSLHTTVVLDDKRVVEIQIRTKEMDQINEYGIAAHWFYKQGDLPKVTDFAWLKQLNALNNKQMTYEEYYSIIRNEILQEIIYVFTPRGELIELPQGATPLDFAYQIHTNIGNHCRGAKVNGSIVALETELPNGCIVEIITGKNASPKPQWLKMAKTLSAQRKIRHELSMQKEFVPDKKRLPTETDKSVPRADRTPKPEKTETSEHTPRIEVEGQKNLLYRLAKCCNPTKNDAIIGYISNSRGIIIHRADCRCLAHITDFDQRRVEVSWSEKK
ncbi:MAG: bifunctional (p)ppGpp synthetase/guanosine-3',5'-bis(diphosphate) 3'-pyrophosphohydrolase [Spirochaetales bacterium]|nr:bifunctional (p)ppGpp synthetase/guanosine-3',5'-bis(diphosphate) 3'-pyrophosphohydrolase [Spirochaetales bacterium]